MASSEKVEGREVEGREKKKEGEAQKKEMVRRAHQKSVFDENEEGKTEKENKRSERRHKARQTLEKFGKWLFLFLILVQNWLSVSAAAEGAKRRTEAMMRMQQEVQI